MFNRNRNFAGAEIALILALIVGLIGVTPAAAGEGGGVSETDNSTLSVHIQTPPYPVPINSGESKLVPFSIAEAENIMGTITNRTYQFFSQYDVPLSESFGPFPTSVEIDSLGTASWNELVYLPKAVANKARSIKEYAIVLKTTFNGRLRSGERFSANSSLLVLLSPDKFSKANPADGAIVSPGGQSLQWNSSVGAVDYEYCFDTIDNDSCDSNWTGTYWLGTYDTNAALQNLPPGTKFYWQVRANNTSGTTYANKGDWWEFTTANSPTPTAAASATPSRTPTSTPKAPRTDTPTSTATFTGTATNVVSLPAEMNKSFSPLTITLGGISRLSVTIYNPNPFPLTSASLVDNLPVGMTIANPVNLSNSCGGTVAAVSGGTSLSLSGGSVPAQVGSTPGSCTVAIDVTSHMPGNSTNTIPAGALTTGNGVTNTTPTSATLTVLPSMATNTATSLPPTATLTLTPGSSGFPSTNVLDTFNRVNGGIGSNWSGFTTAFNISSKKLDVVSSGVNTYIFWKSPSFGSDQEVHVKLTQIDTEPRNEHRLILKSQSNKSSGSGMIQVTYDGLGDTVQVWTYHPTQGWVQHGTNISATFVNGDQFGARARADGTVEIYQNGELIGTRSITSWPYYSNGGYIGLWFVNAPDALLDDFGGGTRLP